MEVIVEVMGATLQVGVILLFEVRSEDSNSPQICDFLTK